MSKLSMIAKIAAGIIGAAVGGYAIHKSVTKYRHDVKEAETNGEPVPKKTKAKMFVKRTWPIVVAACIAVLATSKYRPLTTLNGCGWTGKQDESVFTDEELHKFICKHSSLAERMDPRKMLEMTLWGHIMLLQPEDKWPVNPNNNDWNFYPDFINWFKGYVN